MAYILPFWKKLVISRWNIWKKAWLGCFFSEDLYQPISARLKHEMESIGVFNPPVWWNLVDCDFCCSSRQFFVVALIWIILTADFWGQTLLRHPKGVKATTLAPTNMQVVQRKDYYQPYMSLNLKKCIFTIPKISFSSLSHLTFVYMTRISTDLFAVVGMLSEIYVFSLKGVNFGQVRIVIGVTL